MLRILGVAIIVLNTYYDCLKLNYVYRANERQTRGLSNVVQNIRSYISNMSNYVGVNKWFKNKTKTFRDDFMENVQRGLQVVKKKTQKTIRTKKKHLASSYKPIRKYEHLKIPKNAMQLITAHGYKGETHNVPTYDGYTLTIQRILTTNHVSPNQVVILHHGLLGSSEDWLLLGSGKALPFLLSDQGFDVWLLNARGNKYSRAHDSMELDSFEFWDFSWHEMGIFDLPATITYISDYTRDATLHFIGHSMGGTALLVLLSTYPEYNQKLKLGILLAPLVFMSHAKGPLKYFGDFRSQKNFKIGRELKPNGTFPQFVIDKFCQGSLRVCSNPLLLLTNGGKEISDPEMMHKVLSHVPAGGSSKTMTHYMQLIKSKCFQKFDYGTMNNLKNYKSKYPPKYNLSAINVPIALFGSTSDWLATEPDIVMLLAKLNSVSIYDFVDDFDHFDFVWSNDATYMLYYIIIDMLDGSNSRRKIKPLITTLI